MRILIINQYYPPDATNSARVLGELAEDLARRHDVRVIAGTPSYNPGASTYRPEVPVTRVRSAALGRGSMLGRVLDYASFLVLASFAALRGHRPDVVVVMTNPPLVGLVGVVASMRHTCPLVQLCHDVHPDIAVALGLLRRPRLIALWRGMNRLVRGRAAKIVVVGRDMAERLELEGVPRDRLVFLPTWAPEVTVSEEVRLRVREELGWSGRFVVIHAGNMGLAQNLGVLVRAAARLGDAAPEVLVVFLGDGPARPLAERLVAEQSLGNVRFLGQRPRDEAQRLMAAADVHVVSLVPGLWGCAAPSKTYDIMALSKPFIAAVDRGSEPARVIDEFGCGIWVEADRSDALEEAILSMRGQPLDDLGARAHAGFKGRYERRVVTAATEELLEAVAAERS